MEHTSRLQALTQQLQGLQETLGALEERARYGATRKREAEDNLHKLTGELRTMRAGWVGDMIDGGGERVEQVVSVVEGQGGGRCQQMSDGGWLPLPYPPPARDRP